MPYLRSTVCRRFGDLIPGFTVTQTTGNSAYNWPLLGLGPLLGLSGSTTFSNTFAQVPGLTGASLVTEILSGLNIGGNPVLPPFVQALVNAIIAPLNAINTPSVTALDPRRAGELRSSAGRPVRLARNDADHCPWSGHRPVGHRHRRLGSHRLRGAVLPLGLASFGTAGTPASSSQPRQGFPPSVVPR